MRVLENRVRIEEETKKMHWVKYLHIATIRQEFSELPQWARLAIVPNRGVGLSLLTWLLGLQNGGKQ